MEFIDTMDCYTPETCDPVQALRRDIERLEKRLKERKELLALIESNPLCARVFELHCS